MNEIFNSEYPVWLEERLIILSPAGSSIYGMTLTPDEDPEGKGSDTDYKGVCIPPKSYFLGLDRFSSFDTTGGKNFKSTRDSKDITVMHINKFVSDAMLGVPNNLELLYIDERLYVICNDFGKELISHREDFLSKNGIKYKFGGYAKSQKIRMTTKSTRQILVDKFGYDTKYFSHACRLFLLATELLTDGKMTLPLKEAEWLKECRKGKYSIEEAEKIIDSLDDKMNEAYNRSKLPLLPDYNKINKWLIELNGRALNDW